MGDCFVAGIAVPVDSFAAGTEVAEDDAERVYDGRKMRADRAAMVLSRFMVVQVVVVEESGLRRPSSSCRRSLSPIINRFKAAPKSHSKGQPKASFLHIK